MTRCMLLMVPVLLLGRGMLSADEVELDKLKSMTPSSWKTAKPDNKFRIHQYTVPKDGDDRKDAEVAIFFFGAGSGGGADDNIKRWQKMFIPAEGQKIRSSVENFKVGNVTVAYLDISGTYVTKNPPFDPKAKEERHPDYRMLGVYFGSENGPYFIRMTGPANTVEKSKKGFDEFIKGFK